jgi:hypothetical protein
MQSIGDLVSFLSCCHGCLPIMLPIGWLCATLRCGPRASAAWGLLPVFARTRQ